MSYAIIRNAYYKKDNLAGIYKHNERKNINYSNKDINKTFEVVKHLFDCPIDRLKLIVDKYFSYNT